MDSDSYCSEHDFLEESSIEEDDYLSEEDLVFFMQDSEDDDEEEFVPEPAPRQRSPIKQLDQALVEKMEAANVGRLKWLEAGQTEQTRQMNEQESAMFPPLGQSVESDGSSHACGRWPKKRTPVRMRLDFVKDGPYEIKFKSTERPSVPCNFIICGKQCPYGEKCRFNHDVPMCDAMKNGNLCMRGPACRTRHPAICYCKDIKTCTLFHPKDSDLGKLRSMKTRMCKNVMKFDKKNKPILNGKCPSGDSCKFAHTLQQVKEAVEPCRQKDKCKLVKMIARTNSKNVKVAMYLNVEGQCCRRLHPCEAVGNFVVRTSIKPTAKP